MNNLLRKFLIFPLSIFPLSFSNSIMAAEWSLYGNRIQFDQKFSEMTGIEDQAKGITGEAGFNYKNMLVLGLGASVFFLDDSNQFSERVANVNTPSAPFTAKSDETAGSLFAFAKRNHQFTNYISGNLVLGYEYINYDREIKNCSNCKSENVDIDSGLFVGGGFSLGKKIKLKLQYRAVLGDDVDNQILIGIGN